MKGKSSYLYMGMDSPSRKKNQQNKLVESVKDPDFRYLLHFGK